MDLNKKSTTDHEKSNTIIKIKLSDIRKPIEDEPIYSESDSSLLNDGSDNDVEDANEPEGYSSPNDELSSLRSQENLGGFPAEEDSPSSESRTNLQPGSMTNDPKALSDIGMMSNNDELIEKGSMKNDVEGERKEILDKIEGFSELKEKTGGIILPPNEQSQSQQGNYWKYRKPPKHKHNNVLVDYTAIRMSPNDINQISLERASSFNEYILNNRKRIKEITKSLERQKLSQRFALDSSNSVFPSLFIPLIRIDEEIGEATYENNGCLELEKDSVQKFIELNVANEHSTFDHPSKFAMFYPRRFQRRRRRRRNASKFLNNEQGNAVNPESGAKLD